MTAPATQPFSAEDVALDGTHLVEAGAGTGKTHAIVDVFERLLLERGLDVSKILIVTYTVAATAELRTRIRKRLVELAEARPEGLRAERLRAALRGFDAAPIFTIHGFCQRVLRERAFESGSSFEAELSAETDPLLLEVSEDFWVRELCDASPLFVRWLAEKGWWPSRLATLGARLSARPDLLLRPEPGEGADPDLDRLEAARVEARAGAAAAWDEGGSAAVDALEQAAAEEHLSKTSYRAKSLERLREELPAELTHDRGAGAAVRVKGLSLLDPRKLRASTRAGGVTPSHPLFDQMGAWIESEEVLEDGLRAHFVLFLHEFAGWVREELPRRKRSRDLLFFDDLLLQLRAALAGDEEGALARAIRARYPVALVDEFQDTDPVQYGVFRKVWHGDEAAGEGAALFLIGDPKQAIYGFRGADVLAYLDARGEAGASHRLERNWRSDPALLDGLNALFGGPAPFRQDGIDYEPALPREGAADVLEGPRIRSGLRVLRFAPPPGEEAQGAWRNARLFAAVGEEVARVLAGAHAIEGRPLRPKDVAVLTRTNRQARSIQGALHRRGIACVLQSEESVFETDEAAELERVLRAIVEPEDPMRVRSAVATALLSRGAEEGLAPAPGSDATRVEALWDRWAGSLRECHALWAAHGLPRALRLLWAREGVAPRLLARADGERKVTNLHHLIELLHAEAVRSRLGPLALLHWLGLRRAEARAGRWTPEEAQLRLESDDDAVQLLTVHRAKGLQFPVTICPFLWDGTLLRQGDEFQRFRDPETETSVVEPRAKGLASEEGSRIARREAFAENLRLGYVALTRARHHCSVVWLRAGGQGGAATSPLRHWLVPELDVEGQPAYEGKAADRFKKISDADIEVALDRLAERAGGGLSVETLDVAPPASPPAPVAGADAHAAGDLACRTFTRRLGPGWRVSSFSGLAAGAGLAAGGRTHLEPYAEDGYDYDADGDLPGEGDAGNTPHTVRLADFPAGAAAGVLIHEIFEEIDFEATGELESLAAAKLRARRLPGSWTGVLAAGIRDVLAVPLDDADPASALCRLPCSRRLDEMPFTLPVAGGGRAPLTPGDLADAFLAHAEHPSVREYASRVARLDFAPLSGFLRGFVDLVHERDGRFYLADYKSNHLGRTAGDYEPGALWAAMHEHDYVLQYHLYLVALHRHLANTLPGYDYEMHVGGVHYLFLRGMAPEHPPGCGILFDRPPMSLVLALSALFGSGRDDGRDVRGAR